ncbi:hypothetical protein Clacol_003929 [Clathrus columnatus]|uniref:Nicotianamine synthase n=1 Tax=Clathrus columnatus TaxID=1419009 RepID=A0AAV5A5Z8_9AGAM|nr:hypothetical protein Clacol_003929 [Clathrus columnatus]
MSCEVSPIVLSQLVDLYYRVLALPSLAPSPKVNQTFSELVSLCLQIKVPSNHLTYHLDEICKKDNNNFNIFSLITRAMEAEGYMERYWAGILATADNLQTAMRLFWYWDNYATLTKYELESLKAAGCSTFRRVAFVGSGPLPLTAILIAQEIKSHVVLYDRDAEANELAIAWVKKLPWGKEQFSFRDADVWDVAPDEFMQYDIVWIAASVGANGKEKSGVIKHVRKGMRPGAFLAIRSVEMGCSLLYPEVQHSELGDVDIVRHDDPPQGVVNSVIVLRV